MRIRVRYEGRVQGVGFRASASALARGRPVTGFVRNAHDGSVELEAQGEASAVEAFLDAVSAALRARIDAERRVPCGERAGERAFRIEA